MTKDLPIDLWTLSDLTTPWCLHVVATLRIADHLAAGISELEPLAAAAGCDARALHNVLGHLVGKGVFAEPVPGRFALNAPAQGLLDPMLQMVLDLDGLGGRFAHAWSTLLTYVRTGQPGYEQRFGRPFWDDLDAHPDLGANFDALIGPAGHGPPNGDFQITGGWDSVQSVVDVGGGTGAMLAQVLRLRPGVRGTLVDQPRTVARAAEIFAAAGVSERVTLAGQSFFDSLPASADLYLLKGILNDWPDEAATLILRRCAEAAWPAGRVIVFGGIQPDDQPRQLLIETVLLGGQHRTLAEFRKLAVSAGLEVVAAGPQPSGRFVTECRPMAARQQIHD